MSVTWFELGCLATSSAVCVLYISYETRLTLMSRQKQLVLYGLQTFALALSIGVITRGSLLHVLTMPHLSVYTSLIIALSAMAGISAARFGRLLLSLQRPSKQLLSSI